MSAIDTPDTLRLVDHPSARNAAIATRNLPIGSVILAEQVLVSVLFPDKTGHRCDYCHRSDEQELDLKIRKCGGCGVRSYCGEQCQKLHWNDSHKLDCKTLFDFILSDTCEKLSHDQMMDCQVLSQLVAEIALQRPEPAASIAIFESLLVSPQDLEIPPMIPMKRVNTSLLSRAPELYQRFPNNNHIFSIHLNGVGVAILPLTSRLLNHSCSPNAVLRYILSASQKPRAEVVAIREISEGEEVTIPYLDPAISHPKRQTRLKETYGFDCLCELCIAQSPMGILPVEASLVLDFVRPHEDGLHQFAFGEGITADFRLPEEQLSFKLPECFQPLMDDTILAVLTERFSLASAESLFELAMSTGKTILAIYFCIYPPYFPQTGFHILEMAKVTWNHYTKEKRPEDLEIASVYLTLARRILDVYGREGDSNGPLDEADTLLGWIQTEKQE